MICIPILKCLQHLSTVHRDDDFPMASIPHQMQLPSRMAPSSARTHSPQLMRRERSLLLSVGVSNHSTSTHAIHVMDKVAINVKLYKVLRRSSPMTTQEIIATSQNLALAMHVKIIMILANTAPGLFHLPRVGLKGHSTFFLFPISLIFLITSLIIFLTSLFYFIFLFKGGDCEV